MNSLNQIIDGFLAWYDKHKIIIDILITLAGSLGGVIAFFVAYLKKKLQKYAFWAVAIPLLFLFIFGTGYLVFSDIPITKINIAAIAYGVVLIFVMIMTILIETTKRNLIYQAKIKYGSFHDGDMDIPDNLPTQKKCHSPTREG